ncbi:hypothetical protein K1719_032951 [Acacia pycnantha]|nr:hypothetical protein K1719_032951 [Acacia pycnantha]
MSVPPNSTRIVPALLKGLKKTFEETFEDVSSAKDVKKIIDHLLNQLPRSQQWEQRLRSLLVRYNEVKSSEVRFIRNELAQIKESLAQLAAEADQNDFQALSEMERDIIDKEEPNEHPLVKCLRDEEKGEEAFEQLLDLELLIPYRTDKSPRVSKFQIFPWVRYMLISEAKKEKLLSLQGGIPQFDPSYFRRACLIDGQSESMETLRTIFNVNERDLDFQHQWLAKLKDLVVLQLGRWQVSPTHHIEVRDESFLTGLKTQKLLKYLSLRGISKITALPESIKELVSLEILDLKACHNLETLPDGIASLRKLTHLDVSECYLLDSMPKGIDKLTSLQVLKGFLIGSSQKTPIRIKHLQKDFEKLECLKISWGKAVKEYSLSFPSKLKKLDLEGIPHETKPEWLSPSKLGNLETLCIKGGKLQVLLVVGEEWHNVKYLVLKYTNINMKQIKEETRKSVFPSLQYVKQERELVSMSGTRDDNVPPLVDFAVCLFTLLYLLSVAKIFYCGIYFHEILSSDHLRHRHSCSSNMLSSITKFQKTIWNQWNVRIVILFSLFLQIFLIVSAPSRKRTRSFFVSFVWLAYLLADWAAGYCIGLISNNQEQKSTLSQNDYLMAFWGPFLLLHLGGPDTISAFALEDNELWRRHLLALIFQLVTAAYVFLLTIPHNTLWLPSILMFVAGLIKYAERIHALYVAAVDNFRNPCFQIPMLGPIMQSSWRSTLLDTTPAFPPK